MKFVHCLLCKTKFIVIAAFFSPVIQNAYSQTQTIRGRVLNENNEPLAAASVLVRGTSKGTVTNTSGEFSLDRVSSTDVLVVSYSGLTTQEVTVGNGSFIDVKMQSGSTVLDAVVVTAAGIKRSRRTLGYSVQEVGAEDLVNAREANIVAALSGKAAGVQVTSASGAVGGVAQIRIRGSASLTGNNSPLFVIDGIPIDNSQNRTVAQGDINGGVSQSSRAVDVNPNEVESLTVLKGPAATALYGIRAAAGAVIITLKHGKAGRSQVVFNSSYTVNEQNGYQAMQNKFAQGAEVNGVAQYRDPSTGVATSFGPDISTLTYSSTPSLYTRQGLIVPRSSASSNGVPVEMYDNAGNFFVKGSNFDNYLSFSGGSDKTTFYMSVGNLRQKGIIPKEKFERTTVRLSGSNSVTPKLSLNGSVSYILSTGNRVQQGSNPSGVMAALLRGPKTFDITNGYSDPLDEPLAYSFANGMQRFDGARDNAYWSVNKNTYVDKVDRVIGFSEMNYEFFPWLKGLARAGVDMFNETRKEVFSLYSRAVPLGTITEQTNLTRNFTTDVILTANKKFARDFEVTALVGHNYFNNFGRSQSVFGSQTPILGFENVGGASAISGGAGIFRRKLNAVYSDVRLSYDNWLFLNFSGRNEWSSTLPKDDNSFFYPSVSLGLDVTKALNINSVILSYGKLRASYGQVGNDAPIYALNSYYGNAGTNSIVYTSGIGFPFAGQLGLTLNDFAGNALLKPEVRSSTEFGAELRFFRNKLSIDVTRYNSTSKDLIVNVPLPTSSGFRNSIQNAGEITNKGWEVILDASIIEKRDFSWDAVLNWSTNKSKITKIAGGITSIGVTQVGPLGQMRLVLGEPYGTIFGNDFIRDANGNVVIDDKPTQANGSPNANYGFPFRNPVPQVIGNTNPEWIAGLRNTFTYKKVTLTALIDSRYKFDVFNGTRSAMNQTGTSLETEDRYTPTIIPGVRQSNGKPNDIQVTKGQNWYTGTGGGFGSGVHTQFVEDGTWYRLRDLSLSYQFTSLAKRIKITNLEFGFTGRNLVLITDYSGVDPEVNLNGDNNATAYDYFTIPNTSGYGAFIKVTF